MRARSEPARPLVDDLLDQLIEQNGIRPDRGLEAIAALLDEHPQILDDVLGDLAKGVKTNRGRRGLTAEQVLRTAILMRIYDWTYREAQGRISDSLYLRKFIGFPFGCPLPKTDAFNRAIRRLSPGTIQAFNQLLVDVSIEGGIEDGKRLRVDTTTVDTDIHHPTDSSLLWDSVRKLTALVTVLRERVSGIRFPDRTKRAKKLGLRISNAGKLRGKRRRDRQKDLYQQLLKVMREVLRNTRAAAALAAQSSDPVAAKTVRSIEHYAELADRVVDQTARRINKGETVPATEKIVSIFEPHTAIIRAGKAQKPVEFGRKLLLEECGSGLITHYEVLDGNPNDSTHVSATLDRHEATFGSPPAEYAVDRGFYSSANLGEATRRGVKVCSMPKPGYRNAETRERESSSEFRKARYWRAGIEGTISALKRGRGMTLCRWHGDRGLKLFVGLGVLANNLMLLAKRQR